MILLQAFAAAVAATGGLAAPVPSVTPDILVVAPLPDAFEAPRVPDAKLATMRGGLRLPNGLDVSIGIDIQTRVDGLLVLHTLYASDGPVSGTRVYTDGRDGDRLAPGTTVVTTSDTGGSPVIMTDRSPTGTTISVTPASGASTVNLVNGAQSTWLTAQGQTEVPVTANGAPVTTGPGTFTLTTTDAGTIATLDTGDLRISHLVGQATGAVIANTANDRAIDTISSINVDLSNTAPLLAASMFSNDALALALVRNR